MLIEIRATQAIAEAERKQLGDWLGQMFAADTFGQQYQWGEDDWCLLLKAGGETACHVGLVERTVTVAGKPIRVGGIGGVATAPAWRQQGLAQQLLEKAAAFMRDDLCVEFGLLICAERLIPYYARLGWQVVSAPLLVDQPQGKIVFPTTGMVLPCAGKPWPPGTIDLCGLPW